MVQVILQYYRRTNRILISILVVLGVACTPTKKYKELQTVNEGLSKDLDYTKEELKSMRLINVKKIEYRQADADGDGISDALDRCPNEFGTMENEGCPGIITIEIPLPEPEEEITETVEENYTDAEVAYYISENKKLIQNNQKMSAEIEHSNQLIDSIITHDKFGEDQGYLSIVCPSTMVEGEIEEVWAIIGSVFENKKLNAQILSLANEERIENNQEPLSEIDLEHGIIDLAKQMKIELVENSIDFDEMRLIDGLETKNIDIENSTTWLWQVRPKDGTADKILKLTFKIVMIGEDGKEMFNKAAFFNVKIKVAKSYFQELKEFARNNPEWPITTIIIPIVTFFAGMWREKRNVKRKVT